MRCKPISGRRGVCRGEKDGRRWEKKWTGGRGLEAAASVLCRRKEMVF